MAAELPRATSRPPLKVNGDGTGGVRKLHRQTALCALALARGGGATVVVERRGQRAGRTAARVAKAWNQMLDAAEARHEAFWRAYDEQDGDVLAVCMSPFECGHGAIFVPEDGPMGDEFCMTVEEARATGYRWTYYDGRYVCPECAQRLGVSEAA